MPKQPGEIGQRLVHIVETACDECVFVKRVENGECPDCPVTKAYEALGNTAGYEREGA